MTGTEAHPEASGVLATNWKSLAERAAKTVSWQRHFRSSLIFHQKPVGGW
jgi:hypothetical protein